MNYINKDSKPFSQETHDSFLKLFGFELSKCQSIYVEHRFDFQEFISLSGIGDYQDSCYPETKKMPTDDESIMALYGEEALKLFDYIFENRQMFRVS